MLARDGGIGIRAEKAPGSSLQGRTELRTILDFIDGGDTPVTTRVARLTRSSGDLQDVVRKLALGQAGSAAFERSVNAASACKGRCRGALSARVSRRGSMRLAGADGRAGAGPPSLGDLVRPRVRPRGGASRARVSADLAGRGDDPARAA